MDEQAGELAMGQEWFASICQSDNLAEPQTTPRGDQPGAGPGARSTFGALAGGAGSSPRPGSTSLHAEQIVHRLGGEEERSGGGGGRARGSRDL